MRFNSFDEAMRWYEATPVLVSKCHTKEEDIRPVGSRKRKCERFIKFSNDALGLTDGYYNNMFRGTNGYSDEFVYGMVPILWYRENGAEYIRIRNLTVSHQSPSRSEFLYWYLPKGMTLKYKNNRLYIVYDGVEHYLPKTQYAWDHQKGVATADDGVFLLFRREGDKFVRANEFQTVGKHVDRELKKELKPAIENFFAWMMTVRMMMDPSWEAHRHYLDELYEWANGIDGVSMRYHDLSHLDPNLARQIITTDEHPMKVTFMALLLRDLKLVKWEPSFTNPQSRAEHIHVEITTEEELKMLKTKFNRHMNKLLCVFKTETC